MTKDKNLNEFPEHLIDIERQLWTNDALFYKDNLSKDCLLVFPETGVINRDFAVNAIRKENEQGRKWGEVDFDEIRSLPPTGGVACFTDGLSACRSHDVASR